MPVVSNIKLELLGVAMLNFCIRVVCLLTASLIATPALSQDISGWSDKTVCRLVKSDGGAAYVEEASSRGLDCKAPIKAKPSNPKSDSSTGINRYGGIAEIPESANPNYETLKYYLYRYLYSFNIHPFCSANNEELHCEDSPPRHSHLIEPSDNPYQFKADIREDKYIKKQMQDTALLSYLLYENDKIVIDEISPNGRFGGMFRDSSKFHSQSVAKTLIGYVAGHAICKGYIDSVDSRLDDWPALQNTLYHNQKLIDILNMAAGTQAYFDGSNMFSNSKRTVTSPIVEDIMKNELKGSKKSSAKYHYNNLNSHVVGSYLIYKIGDDNFQQLLDDVFKKKARIEGDVFFLKNERAKKDDISIWSNFYATRYDYLRIAKAMLDDWQNDTCVGNYLRTIHSRRIKKGDWGGEGGDTRVGMPKGYAGFFHTSYKGMSNRPVMSMDGYGGQSIAIDFERGRIVATQAIHDNMKFPKAGSYNWKKIVYQTIKNGKPASILTVKVKQPIEPVIDPQQIILDNEAKKEVERIAKEYWDDHYDAIDEASQGILYGGSADGSMMFSEDFEIEGQRDVRVDDENNKWYIKQDNDGNSVYCNRATDDWTQFSFGSAGWSDYSISYRMKFSAGKGGRAETHIRKTHDSDYRANIGSYGDIEIQFAKNADRFYEPIASDFVSIKTGEWLDIQLTASGDNIKYLINGEAVASAKDNRAKKGSGFFAVSANSEVCIDDIVVNKM
jgi:CubicO group peptidase (beta-lactamase class C family)